MGKVLVRGSTATYRDSKRKNDYCDLEQLAEIYSNWGNVPERINNIRAQEISLMATYFKYMFKEKKKRERVKLKGTTV